MCCRKMGFLGETSRLGCHLARRLHDVNEQVDEQRGRYKIEHDRRNDDMAASAGLKVGGHCCPGCAENRGADDSCRKRQRPMRPSYVKADQRCAYPANCGLAFAANVEQSSVERHSDGQSGKDEVRCVIQRIAPAIRRPYRPLEHNLHRDKGVFRRSR